MLDVTAFLRGLRRVGQEIETPGGSLIGFHTVPLGGDDVMECLDWLVASAHLAAPLVYCANCRYWLRIEANEGDCTAHKHPITARGDCYCSWGKEKDA